MYVYVRKTLRDIFFHLKRISIVKKVAYNLGSPQRKYLREEREREREREFDGEKDVKRLGEYKYWLRSESQEALNGSGIGWMPRTTTEGRQPSTQSVCQGDRWLKERQVVRRAPNT